MNISRTKNKALSTTLDNQKKNGRRTGPESRGTFLCDTDRELVWATQFHNRLCFAFHLDGWTLEICAQNAQEIENLGTSAYDKIMTF